MADGVRQQLEAFWRACRWGDVRLARQVQRNDDVVDRFNHEIIDYLSRITGERSQRDNRWQIALMNFTVELESIGDLLDKHLCDLVAKQRVEGALIGRDDWSDLDVIYQRLLGRFDRVVSLLARYDSDVMTVFAEEKRDFNEDCWKLQQLHYDRLRSDPGASVIDNTYFIDYLNGLRGIHHHLSGMGHSLVSAARECD